MSRRRRIINKMVLGFTCAVVALPVLCEASTHSWTGLDPRGAWWDYSANWDSPSQPADGENALIIRSGSNAFTVNYWNTLYPAATLNELQLDQLGGGSLTLDIAGHHRLAATQAYIGIAGNALLVQSTGTVSFSTLTLGQGATGTGTYSLNGTSNFFSKNVNVGVDGTGIFNQSFGTVGDNFGVVAVARNMGSNGAYNLTSGSLVPGWTWIGINGSGTLLQTGGTLNTRYLEIGRAGDGTLGSGWYQTSNSAVVTARVRFSVGLGSNVHQDGGDIISTTGEGLLVSGTYVQSAGTLTLNHMQISGSFRQTGGRISVPYIANMGQFEQAGGLLEVSGSFQNHGSAVFGGSQNWEPGADFVGVEGVATFLSDAGSPTARPLTINVEAGTIVFDSGQHLAALNLASGARVLVRTGGSKIVSTASFDIVGGRAPRASLDLSDGALIVDYSGASPFETLRDQIRQAFHNGAWDADGIRSSLADSTHAVGYAEAASLFGALPGNFSGETVDATSVLVKFTYCGDTDLNGVVDIRDLYALASHWQSPGDWIGGDFNYDGTVNVADLTLLAANWQAGVSSVAGASLDGVLTSLHLPLIDVPEPGGLSGLAILAIGSVSRLRRTRRNCAN